WDTLDGAPPAERLPDGEALRVRRVGNQSRDRRLPVDDDDAVAAADRAKMLAELGLEFRDIHAFHDQNIVMSSHDVKNRPSCSRPDCGRSSHPRKVSDISFRDIPPGR